MLKVLAWVVSNDGRFFKGAINILAHQHNGVELVAVTASVPVRVTKGGKPIPFLSLAEVAREDYNVLLVVGAKKIGMSKIVKAARQLKFPEEKLLGDWIVCIPGFMLDKYRKLQRSRLSIFSINCFGGMISHLLGLPFRSPFGSIGVVREDFLTFLRTPRKCMLEPLFYRGQKLNEKKNENYPLARLGDIKLSMMHYKTFDDFVRMWERRKTRINWYNLFVVMCTTNLEELQRFDALPYGKKVCFVPFKSDLDSAWYINPEIDKTEERFVFKFNNFAKGKFFYYDVFDMLLYGKKTQLIDI